MPTRIQCMTGWIRHVISKNILELQCLLAHSLGWSKFARFLSSRSPAERLLVKEALQGPFKHTKRRPVVKDSMQVHSTQHKLLGRGYEFYRKIMESTVGNKNTLTD